MAENKRINGVLTPTNGRASFVVDLHFIYMLCGLPRPAHGLLIRQAAVDTPDSTDACGKAQVLWKEMKVVKDMILQGMITYPTWGKPENHRLKSAGW